MYWIMYIVHTTVKATTIIVHSDRLVKRALVEVGRVGFRLYEETVANCIGGRPYANVEISVDLGCVIYDGLSLNVVKASRS